MLHEEYVILVRIDGIKISSLINKDWPTKAVHTGIYQWIAFSLTYISNVIYKNFF